LRGDPLCPLQSRCIPTVTSLHPVSRTLRKMIVVLLTLSTAQAIPNDPNELQYLNNLPLDKLIQLKSSLQELVTGYENVTTTPSYIEDFAPQALPFKSAPLKRTDYDVYKKDSSKISNLFTMSVTTLAFLAFGGYLLCLVVQAVKSKHNINSTTITPTILINSGIRRPQNQFTSYGRKKRSLREMELPPEQAFDVLLKLCEGYAKWSERYGDGGI
jgi:hypothetical protein